MAALVLKCYLRADCLYRCIQWSVVIHVWWSYFVFS